MQKREMVGAFQRIPMVMPATDILMSAQRKSRNVPPTKGILQFNIYFSIFFLVATMTFHIQFWVTYFVLRSIYSVGIQNIAKRERNKGAKQLDALMKVSPLCCCTANANSSTWLLRAVLFFRNFRCH